MQDMTTKPQLQEIDQQLGAMIEEIQSLREQLTKMGMAGTQELEKQHPRHNNVRWKHDQNAKLPVLLISENSAKKCSYSEH